LSLHGGEKTAGEHYSIDLKSNQGMRKFKASCPSLALPPWQQERAKSSWEAGQRLHQMPTTPKEGKTIKEEQEGFKKLTLFWDNLAMEVREKGTVVRKKRLENVEAYSGGIAE